MTASQPPQPSEGGQPPPGAQQPPPGYGQPAGQPASGQPQYGRPAHGQPQYGQPPYTQPPYTQPPYTQQAYPYPSHGQPPYGQPPYGQPPYGQPPYGQAPYGPPGYPYGRSAGGGAEFSFDLKRLTGTDYAVAGATLFFLLLGFLPWWRFGDATFGVTFSGFDDGMVVSAFMLFLLATGWAVLPAFVRTTPTFPRSSVTVGLAGLGLVLTLFAWLDTLRYAFSFWAFLAFLTAVAITAVAALALRREMRDRPARPTAPQPGGYWPGAGAPGQPYPYAPQQPGRTYPPAAGPFPPHAYPGQPGPSTAPHGYGPTTGPWSAPPRPPEQEDGPGVTESERPRTDT